MAPRALADRETRQRRMLPSNRSHNNHTSGNGNNEEALPRQSLVITSTTSTTLSSQRRILGIGSNGCAVAVALWFGCLWFIVFVAFLVQPYPWNPDGIQSRIRSHPDAHVLELERLEQVRHQRQHEHELHLQQNQNVPSPAAAKPHLVSRLPNQVVATADVRGNLGPASVVVQQNPGTDWIHDRWQAASNMHGKQIPGAHWIQLEFRDSMVVADRIVLDWETAYADEYVLEASLEPIAHQEESNDHVWMSQYDESNDKVWILFDGRQSHDVATMRSVTESGQSPGVKEKRPLHVVHEIRLDSAASNNHNKPFRYLRLRILKSVTGWGVSLWQFDVYGVRSDELQTSR